MKMRFIILISGIFLFNSSLLPGQDNNKNTLKNNIYLGYPATIFDAPDLGLYVAYNPYYPLNKYFNIEFQISYTYGGFDREEGWFRHNGGSIKYGNLLAGIRLFFFSGEKKINPYINLLGGACYYYDKEYTYNNMIRKESGFIPGFSAGLYFQLYKNFNIGIAAETYPSMILKGGFTF